MSVLMDYSLSSGANTFSHPCGCAELRDTIYESRLTSMTNADTAYSSQHAHQDKLLGKGTNLACRCATQNWWLLDSRWLHKKHSVHPAACSHADSREVRA